ncbi:hypothetical protein TNCV_4217381 [Trichonephila clavipes]|nr:hypothetical protein TNCV_4217381 [Trichonephila clavipes]
MKLKLSGATAHVSIPVYGTLGVEVHEQISRSGGQLEAKPQCLSPQQNLVLIYQPTAGVLKTRSEKLVKVLNKRAVEHMLVQAIVCQSLYVDVLWKFRQIDLHFHQSRTRAIGGRPCNFEPRSSDERDT